MPSASLAPDLWCSGCGKLLVRNGQLYCKRSRTLVPAILGEKEIPCPKCRKPRILLARHDEALCSNKQCINRQKGIGTPMLQEHNEVQEMSKTQEMLGWLDGEIARVEKDISMLSYALEQAELPVKSPNSIFSQRYGGLTSDEREQKMREDRAKLEELKKRLGQLEKTKKRVSQLEIILDLFERAGHRVFNYPKSSMYHESGGIGINVGGPYPEFPILAFYIDENKRSGIRVELG